MPVPEVGQGCSCCCSCSCSCSSSCSFFSSSSSSCCWCFSPSINLGRWCVLVITYSSPGDAWSFFVYILCCVCMCRLMDVQVLYGCSFTGLICQFFGGFVCTFDFFLKHDRGHFSSCALALFHDSCAKFVQKNSVLAHCHRLIYHSEKRCH